MMLFATGNDKSPGPDGYTSFFFRKAWDIVKGDVIKAVLFFFDRIKLPTGFNSTFITLVPKSSNINTMADFRPISCCNVVYKCISRILANTLQPILASLIFSNQNAFVEGQSISDNVFLAQEMVKGYGRSIISPRCALKAFDSVHW